MAAQHLAGHVLPMPNEYTSVYEFYATLEGFEEALVSHIEQEERDRLVDLLEEREASDVAFASVSEARGLETYFNLDRVLYINLLDYIGGVAFEKEKKLSEAETESIWEERMESDKTVSLWVWTLAKKEPELHYGVAYHEWDAIQMALGNNNQRCIGFTDGDGERVVIPLKNLVAVEMCDEFFHGDDVLERFAEKYNKREKDREPIEIPVTA
jgi:hypothetical protein